MSAILRAYGTNFDVDAFVASCAWKIAAVFHRGDARLPGSRRTTSTRESSGMNVDVSGAGFDQFARQVGDATAFLREHADTVRRLVAFPGVEAVVLDFGIARRDGPAQSDVLPAELIRLAGACGIALELSHYSISGDEAGR